MTVQVVTDSSSRLSDDERKRWSIRQVPLHVLVDDLDRCSPDSVVAILEAIKVFLSVPKMAFVLAALGECTLQTAP